MIGVFLQFSIGVPYWKNPSIHNIGNGRLHAAIAPFATKLIDCLSYKGMDIRAQIIDEIQQQYENEHENGGGVTWVDFCCGVGFSTPENSVGIDASPHMINAARRNHKSKIFEVENAETYGQDEQYDIVSIFFALHEIPHDARMRVIQNAERVARKKVILCDISPNKNPSRIMLSGEPYLLEYQKNIVHELKAFGATVHERIPNHVIVAEITKPNLE